MTSVNNIHRNTIGAALDRSARKHAQKRALTFGERTWSYQALNNAANQVANALLEAGLAPGDRLAVYGKNSDAYVIAWLACSKAGLIHVPVNFALSSDELRYILEQSGAKGVLSDAVLADKVRAAVAGLSLVVNGTLQAEGASLQEDAFDVLACTHGFHASQAHAAHGPDVALEGASVAQLLYTLSLIHISEPTRPY